MTTPAPDYPTDPRALHVPGYPSEDDARETETELRFSWGNVYTARCWHGTVDVTYNALTHESTDCGCPEP